VLIGEPAVRDYFGVPPSQVRDVLAIMGDKVDNVPGVKGIGEKGAAKLVAEFGTLESIYDNLERVPNPRIRGLLAEHKALALLSKDLVTIDTQVPLEGTDDESLRYDWAAFCSHAGVRQALTDMRMVSMLRGLDGGGAKNKAWPNVPKSGKKDAAVGGALDLFGEVIPGTGSGMNDAGESTQNGDDKSPPARAEITYASWGERRYETVLTKERLEEVFAQVAHPDTKIFALDTETTGLDILENIPIGVSLSFSVGTGIYIPAHEAHLRASDLTGLSSDATFTQADVWDGLARVLATRTATVVGHNLKFDVHQLLNKKVGIGPGRIADTMVSAFLIDPGASGTYGLDAQTLKHFNLKKISTAELIGKGTGRSTMLDVPLATIAEYAAEDVDATLRLWNHYEPLLAEGALPFLMWEMEMPLLRVLVDMERAGVHIDGDYLAEFGVEVQDRIQELERQVHAAAGEPFNLGSPKQLGVVLFEKLKVHEATGYKGKLARTSLGYKTDASVLENFVQHPVVSLVQEHRELSKLLGTYILTLPQLVKQSTGRIHTQFNQIGAATGRLSSNDPNLQNIPIRTPLGKKVRKAFSAASPGCTIISADYSQVELRVMAHLANDPNMLAAFRSGADIHRETASKMLGRDPADISSDERSSAKAINFGIIYGMGAQRLARDQKISQNEAKTFIERYFMNFSRVRDYLDSQKVMAHEKGYVETAFGRRRPIRIREGMNPGELRAAENVAINSPIQGTAADIMKLGMLRAHDALKKGGFETRLLLQVHDELVLEGPQGEAEDVARVVREAMQGAVDFSIPLLVDVSQGKNWLEAK